MVLAQAVYTNTVPTTKYKMPHTKHCLTNLSGKPVDKCPPAQVTGLRDQTATGKLEAFKMEPRKHTGKESKAQIH